MTNAPRSSDGAEVICFVELDETTPPTGNCTHSVNGAEFPPVSFAGLIVAQYAGEKSFFLFYCDDGWNVITDTWHQTLEDAISQANFEFENLSNRWATP
ncbi:hypothetical protein [Botrimarina sp.]|uniref:hypothetical protein n=1 Tax=Botrimarina sp. TaxID=2795802 RepID=UPI0032ECE9C7